MFTAIIEHGVLIMNYFNSVCFTLLSLLAIPAAAGAISAFPGAEGYGAASIGGRGGRVIYVTNLNDSGPGSFRDAVTQTGPRTVEFQIGGTISLLSDININASMSYLTIAGQTAPGGGIQTRYATINITDGAHDVIVRFLRHRHGVNLFNNTSNNAAPGLMIYSYTTPVYNVILDHCSFAWAQDDTGSWNMVHDISWQWNIFAEAKNSFQNPAVYPPSGTIFDGTAGKGSIHGAEPGNGTAFYNISYHHNFLANNNMRNPMLAGHGPIEIVNNVIFNYAAFGTEIQNRGGGAKINLIGNNYKAGPDTYSGRYEMFITQGYDTGGPNGNAIEELPQMVYLNDNLGPHRTSSSQPQWDIMGYCGVVGTYCSVPASTVYQATSPWPSSAFPITTVSSANAVSTVLNGAGAVLPARDAFDAKLVSGYNNGTGTNTEGNIWPTLASGTPLMDSDGDGIPDAWEIANGLNPNNSADGAQVAANGYTNLENYLNGVTSSSPPPPPPTGLPDLIATSISYSSSTGNFTTVVKNQGTVSTPSGIVIGNGFYVDGNLVTWGDNSSAIAPLAPGASITIDSSKGGGTYAIPTGTHTIMVKADDYATTGRITESNETNNTLSQSITIASALPDLVATSVTYSSATGLFTSVVKNQGTAATPAGVAIGNGFYVDGILAVSGSVAGPLAAGASITVDSSVGGVFKITSGTHTIMAKADDGARITESDETNNTISQTITVAATLPDLIIVPGSLSYANGIFTATMKNQGGSAASASSLDIGFQVDGIQITYGSVLSSLAPGASVTINNTNLCAGGGYCGGAYAIPTGTHTIAAAADPASRITESSESNNMLSQSITIASLLPDVVVTALSYSSATGLFTSVVKNQGGAATPTGIVIGNGFYVDGSYVVWGSVPGPLAPGASVTITSSLGGVYRLASGTHTIMVKADDYGTNGRFAESNEANNTLSQALTVTP